eukprot:TRINITY_DN8959_c0_g1_i1.p1 TRINITY_DN8959_c0_g1~~TRINITY_DN8959_c0_g1_i1.p1  ORF type:complete len:790 (+),score=254.67 TRINITY_DN8959_c0_g1_i1:90-2459(+)
MWQVAALVAAVLCAGALTTAVGWFWKSRNQRESVAEGSPPTAGKSPDPTDCEDKTSPPQPSVPDDSLVLTRKRSANPMSPFRLVDTTGDGVGDTLLVDTTGDGRVDTALPLNGTPTAQSTPNRSFRGMQTEVSQLMPQNRGSFRSDPRRGSASDDETAPAAKVVDTTGDGRGDTLLVDTTGDGKVDTAMPFPCSPTSHDRALRSMAACLASPPVEPAADSPSLRTASSESNPPPGALLHSRAAPDGPATIVVASPGGTTRRLSNSHAPLLDPLTETRVSGRSPVSPSGVEHTPLNGQMRTSTQQSFSSLSSKQADDAREGKSPLSGVSYSASVREFDRTVLAKSAPLLQLGQDGRDATADVAELESMLPGEAHITLDSLHAAPGRPDDDWAEIGRGAFGRVYRAYYSPALETVAVKELQSDEVGAADVGTSRCGPSVTALRRRCGFLREVLWLHRLRCGSLLTFYGWTLRQVPGSRPRLCIVTELCSGGSLHRRLPDAKLTPGRRGKIALELGEAVCKALAFLHSRGLVHLDVAARNVLLRQKGSADLADSPSSGSLLWESTVEYKLADVGLLTGEGCAAPVVPIAWSPPEALAKCASARTATWQHDAWSYGCLLYEVLEGGQPWWQLLRAVDSGRSFHVAVAAAVRRGETPPRPRALQDGAGGLAERVWTLIILECWADDPRRRPGMPAVAERLKAVRQRGRSDTAAPPKAPPSATKVAVVQERLQQLNPYNPDPALPRFEEAMTDVAEASGLARSSSGNDIDITDDDFLEITEGVFGAYGYSYSFGS